VSYSAKLRGEVGRREAMTFLHLGKQEILVKITAAVRIIGRLIKKCGVLISIIYIYLTYTCIMTLRRNKHTYEPASCVQLGLSESDGWGTHADVRKAPSFVHHARFAVKIPLILSRVTQ
jgi:hypothetical protein